MSRDFRKARRAQIAVRLGESEYAATKRLVCGSGTTLEAARQLGRRAIGIEISEEACAYAVKRLAQLSLFATEGAAS